MNNAVEMLKSQLDNLDRNELDQVIAYCGARKESIKAEVAERLMSEIQQKLHAAGLDTDFLVEKLGLQKAPSRQGKQGGRLPFRYLNPANPNEGWSGRGRKPAWLREKEEQGIDIENFRI